MKIDRLKLLLLDLALLAAFLAVSSQVWLAALDEWISFLVNLQQRSGQ